MTFLSKITALCAIMNIFLSPVLCSCLYNLTCWSARFFALTILTRNYLSYQAPLLRAFAELRKATVSFLMSVRPSVRMKQLGSHPMKFYIWIFCNKKKSRKFKFHYNGTIIASNLHDDRCTYVVISRSVLLILRNVSDERYWENQNTHFTFNNFSENRAVYEIMRHIFK